MRRAAPIGHPSIVATPIAVADAAASSCADSRPGTFSIGGFEILEAEPSEE